MAKTKFNIGDRVNIKWRGNKAHGKTGTIVKYHGNSWWVVKIPGFNGHAGDIEDGTNDKWFIGESCLIKLPAEKESMKIEVKQTAKKTEKPKEITYPCFKKSNNGNELIVLFFSNSTGIVVDSGSSPWVTGLYFDKWLDFSEFPLENYSATISSKP